MSRLPPDGRPPTFQLVYSKQFNEVTRDVGQDVFVDLIPYEYKVYLFYYPSIPPNEELENQLRNLGEMAGKNLLVNIGRLDDPKYDMIADKFKISSLPVIVLTGTDSLASLRDQTSISTIYIRLDNERLLRSVNLTIKCVEQVFHFFIRGEIKQALDQYENYQRDELKGRIREKIIGGLKGIANFLSDRDIVVSLLEGKFELRRTT